MTLDEFREATKDLDGNLLLCSDYVCSAYNPYNFSELSAERTTNVSISIDKDPWNDYEHIFLRIERP